MRHRLEDRRRVQTAIAVGKVDDAYVKPTAKIIDLTQSPSSSRPPSSSQLPSPSLPPLLSQPPSMQPGPSSKKRKAENDERQMPTAHAPLEIIIDDDEEDDEDTIDELYCTISTSIVGVQYYHGKLHLLRVVALDSLTSRRRIGRCWRASAASSRTPQPI
jgi:SWI/SNF-related matrix-associated actin-dependent regulator of chromatin subfamily A3